MFMACHYFLFTYPKNGQVLAKDFQFGSANTVIGEKFWSWMGKIAALQADKVVWPEKEYMKKDSAKYVVTVDCIDCHILEPKHHTKNTMQSIPQKHLLNLNQHFTVYIPFW